MRTIIGSAFISLDGVMQAPGRPTEDPTGGFELGGWLPNHGDELIGEAIDELFDGQFDLLLGRQTYDLFAAFWPYVESDDKPMGEMFDRVQKYVVTHGDQPLNWQKSHRLMGIEVVARLRSSDGADLIIQDSSTLYPQLLAAGLLDRLILMTIPIVLGGSKRLFGEGTPSGAMRMIDHKLSRRGTMVATYEADGPVRLGTFLTPEPSAAELWRRKAMAEVVW